MYKQTDRQTDNQIDRQSDRHRQTDNQTGGSCWPTCFVTDALTPCSKVKRLSDSQLRLVQVILVNIRRCMRCSELIKALAIIGDAASDLYNMTARFWRSGFRASQQATHLHQWSYPGQLPNM